jgi:hypothetical protein
MIALHFFFMAAMTPIFLPALSEWLCHRAGLPAYVPVSFFCSVVFLAAMITVYWLTLGPLGRLLQKRETKILESVTAEVE